MSDELDTSESDNWSDISLNLSASEHQNSQLSVSTSVWSMEGLTSLQTSSMFNLDLRNSEIEVYQNELQCIPENQNGWWDDLEEEYQHNLPSVKIKLRFEAIVRSHLLKLGKNKLINVLRQRLAELVSTGGNDVNQRYLQQARLLVSAKSHTAAVLVEALIELLYSN